MTVKELIRHLKKCDPDSEVVWQSHDQSPNESDGHVRRVQQADEDFFRGNPYYDGSRPVAILT